MQKKKIVSAVLLQIGSGTLKSLNPHVFEVAEEDGGRRERIACP